MSGHRNRVPVNTPERRAFKKKLTKLIANTMPDVLDDTELHAMLDDILDKMV